MIAVISDVDMLLETLKLPQYSVLFMQNGYFSLEQICEITNETELREIGIEEDAHLCLIMNEILKLKNPDHPLYISIDNQSEQSEKSKHKDSANSVISNLSFEIYCDLSVSLKKYT